MSIRYARCELTGFGPVTSLAFKPGINLITGDVGGGRDTILMALNAAFRGMAAADVAWLSGGDKLGLKLNLETSVEDIELTCDFTAPKVQMQSGDGMLLFAGPTWDELLSCLEYRTGLNGLSQTCGLALSPQEFVLPPDLCPLLGAPARSLGELIGIRSRLEEQRRDLLRMRTQVVEHGEALAPLRQKLAPADNARLANPSGTLLRDLQRLAGARKQLADLQLDESSRSQKLARDEARLSNLRGALDPGFVGVEADFPQQLTRYKELEPLCSHRRAEVAGLEKSVKHLEKKLHALSEAVPRLAVSHPDLLQQLSEPDGQDVTSDVLATLKEANEALEQHQLLRDVPEDFDACVLELQKARQNRAAQEEAVGIIDGRLKAANRERASHEGAVQWPADFSEQLSRLRKEQASQQERLQSLAETVKMASALAGKQEDFSLRLAEHGGLEAEGDDFPQRLATLCEARQKLRDESLAMQEVQVRVADIAATVQQKYAHFVGVDDYPQHVEALRIKLAQLAEQRKQADTWPTRKLEMAAEQARLQHRFDTEFQDLVNAPEDVEAQLAEYLRVTDAQWALEARREELSVTLDVRRDKLKREFAPFAELDAASHAVLVSTRDEDEWRRRLLLRLDGEVQERKRIEDELATLESELDLLSAWADLPDGFPTLRALQSELEGEMAEQSRILDDLDRQIVMALNSLVNRGPESSGTVRLNLDSSLYDLVARWEEHFRRQRETDALGLRVATARSELAELIRQLGAEGLPLEPSEVATWLSLQQELAALQSVLEPDVKGRKKRGRLEEVQAALAQQFKAWHIESASDVAGLLSRDLAARDRLAALRAQLASYEALLVQARDEPTRPVLQAETQKISQRQGLDGNMVVDLGREWDRCKSVLVLQARRSEVARRVEQLRQRARLLPTRQAGESEQAYHRLRELHSQRIDLRARLQMLRPVSEVDADRANLVAVTARAASLGGLGRGVSPEQHVRQYLEYQHAEAETTAMAVALRDVAKAEDGTDRLEKMVADKARLESVLGKLATQDPAVTLARRTEYLSLRGRFEELRQVLSEAPSQARLRKAVETLKVEVRKELERLHVASAEDLDAALVAFEEYRGLAAQRRTLEAELETRWHTGLRPDGKLETDVHRLQRSVKKLESELSPWSAEVEQPSDVEPLVARWKAARELAESLRKVETRLEAHGSPQDAQKALDGVQKTLREACKALGVPEAATGDDALLARHAQAISWRTQITSLEEERRHAIAALEQLGEQVADLEEHLGVGPKEGLELVLQAYREAQKLKARREALARQLAKLEEQKAGRRALEASLLAALQKLGFEGLTVHAVVEQYQQYLQLDREVKATKVKLDEARQGPRPLAQIELELAELRPRLKGHHAVNDLDAELAAYAAYRKTVERCEALEQTCAELRKIDGLQKVARVTSDLVAETEARIKAQFPNRDIDEVVAVFEHIETWQAEAEQHEKALLDLPHRVRLSLRLDAVDRQLASLAQTTGEGSKIVLNAGDAQCLVRASSLLDRLTGGEYSGLAVRNGTPVLGRSDEWLPLAATGKLRRQADLSWLLAMILELKDACPWPVLLDDPFFELTPGECDRTLGVLEDIAKKRQVIVLTANRNLGRHVAADLVAAGH